MIKDTGKSRDKRRDEDMGKDKTRAGARVRGRVGVGGGVWVHNMGRDRGKIAEALSDLKFEGKNSYSVSR